MLETRAKTYVACLDCGKEFDYDWKQMRVGAPLPAANRIGDAIELHQ